MTLKGQYHEYVTNLTYAAIGLTTVHREVVFFTFRTFSDVLIGHVTNMPGAVGSYN